jgi:hypothetical protein
MDEVDEYPEMEAIDPKMMNNGIMIAGIIAIALVITTIRNTIAA